MNLSGVAFWSSAHPFIDRLKSSLPWTAYGNWQPLAQKVGTDARGNPVILPAGTDYLATAVDLDPASAGTSHTYVLTWQGGGTLLVGGTTVLSAAPGRVVLRYDGEQEWAQLAAIDLDPANLPHDVHLVRADQADLFAAGEIFNPEFLAKTAPWDTLRFKDWEGTDNSTLTSWSQRTAADTAFWGGPAGVPIEVQVRLANQSHANMWIDMPVAADDDYVRRTLAYVHDHLDPGLTVRVEYSNEVWNWGYSQAHYARDAADRLWGVDANGDGVVSATDPAEHVGDGWTRWYGYRSAQVAAIARSVFADAPDRVDPVLATQTDWKGLEQSILAGVAAARLGSVGTLFDSYAVATYFGSDLDGGSAADRAQVLAWARGGAAGMDAAFRQLETGGQLGYDMSLRTLASTLAYQHDVAAQNGLQLVAYEGGAHLTAVGFDPAVQPEVEAFFERLNADPRMGALYTKMAETFSAAGGTDLAAFADISRSGQYGDWGMLQSVYDDGSARYDALAAYAARAPAGPVETQAASYTLDQTASDLTYTGTATFRGTGNQFANVITAGAKGSQLFGLAGDDTLIGGAGRDDLDGGIGGDRMAGGANNDTYHVDDLRDTVVEKPLEGLDLVLTTLAAYTLPDNVENLSAVAGTPRTGPFVGTGNALNNQLTADDGGSRLYGLAGNDALVGGAGADLLDGGTGADRMAGGAGDDVYLVDSSGDTVTELAGGGMDEVRTTLAVYTLGAEVEKLTALGTGVFIGTGNALANVITAAAGADPVKLYGLDGNDLLTGGAGADLLDGGAGADRMAGGAGDDTYLVDDAGDAVIEAAGGGTDTVRTGLAAYTLPAGVEKLVYIGTGDFIGIGNDLDNSITAGARGSNLYGYGGDDVLTGGALANYLDGGTGADRMAGGGGDDIYVVDNVGDMVVELADAGHDKVVSSVSYTLGANLEDLFLTGTDALTGRGNAVANAIQGNAGANTLWGMGGDDFLVGQDANDALRGGDGDDQLYGRGGADVLDGGAGRDVLVADGGNDTLIGGPGQDFLNGGAGADRFIFRTGDFATSATGDPWTANWADQITDFSHAERDRIDLSGVDTGTAGQVFTFLGTNPFTGHAGELRAVVAGAGLDVMGDTNGDGVADFHLYLASWTTPPTPLVAADFIL